MGNEGSTLVNSEGQPVLDINGRPIIFGNNLSTDNITIDMNGDVIYDDGMGNYQQLLR